MLFEMAYKRRRARRTRTDKTEGTAKTRRIDNARKTTLPEEMAHQQRTTKTTTNGPTNQGQEKAKRGRSALKAPKQKAKETKRKRNQNKKKLKKRNK